jgi:hypothetical protein
MFYLKFQLNNETKSALDLNVINVEVSEKLLMAGNNVTTMSLKITLRWPQNEKNRVSLSDPYREV